jgi:hypothetical protein
MQAETAAFIEKTSRFTVDYRAGPLYGGTRLADRPCAQPKCPRRAGRSPGWLPKQELPQLGQVGECGIPSISRRATTHQPGGRARRRALRFRRRLPPSWCVVGLRQIDGMPYEPHHARSLLAPSPGRRTLGSSEKPQAVARAFPLINPLHPPVGPGEEVQGGQAGLYAGSRAARRPIFEAGSWRQDHSRHLDLDQLPHGFSTRARIGCEQL